MRLKTLQRLQLLRRVTPRIDLPMRFGDLPLLVDDVRDPFRIFVLRRISRAVRETDFAIGVAQKREREVILLGELRVGGGVIETDAEDRRVLCGVLRAEVPEPGTLGRSAGCVGLRIKPEHNLASAQIVQRNVAAEVIAHLEVRSLVANLQHASSSNELTTNRNLPARDMPRL